MPITPTALKELKKIGLTDAQISKFQVMKAKPLPMSTKLDSMGFPASAVSKLPSNLRSLTKADLMSLGGWGTAKLTPAASKLSVRDVQSIKNVLGGKLGGGANPLAMDVYCCCCPCCCAASVTIPVVQKAAHSYTAL